MHGCLENINDDYDENDNYCPIKLSSIFFYILTFVGKLYCSKVSSKLQSSILCLLIINKTNVVLLFKVSSCFCVFFFLLGEVNNLILFFDVHCTTVEINHFVSIKKCGLSNNSDLGPLISNKMLFVTFFTLIQKLLKRSKIQ